MTKEQYCDPKLFPITTQRGMSFKEQNQYDKENYEAFLANLDNPMLAGTTHKHGAAAFREYCVKLGVPVTPELEVKLGFPKHSLKPYDENMMGLDAKTYDKDASSYAKQTIFIWLLAGYITNLIDGKLISLSSLLLFFPGIFLASLIAFCMFWLRRKKVLAVTNTKSVPILMLFTLTTILEYGLPIIAAVFFAKAIQ